MRFISGDKEAIFQQLHTAVVDEAQIETELAVKRIVADVRENGDEALKRLTAQFDGVTLTDFRVSQSDLDDALQHVEADFIQALEQAKENILSYHQKQKQSGFVDTEKRGVMRGQLVRPLETAGIYVPGGTAAYPSSVLMNILPAKIAGVPRIIMVTPPGADGLNPYILAAAKIAGADEVYQVGGAQAVAALAFGTASIPKVDKIVGPGNMFVALAKREVFGIVDIDMIAGPSEVVVVADATANPRFVAADLLSQAEHDKLARAILITTSEPFGQAVASEVEKQLRTLPREEIARASIANFGQVIVADSIEAAFEIMNDIAPEHLEIQLENPMDYLSYVKNAGSVFLGAYASEPLGDYFAGPNHVLPTSGTARFFSPLGVADFCKRTSFISYTKDALEKEKDAIVLLAEKEGLTAHARAIQIRFEEEN
ncbi:bifunctional histidinal dehydrogenase/ histidinol dehydrogenase [Listeria grandensis FSL F6-0971]|uniref:Histidinol dehydrogenase n=1 Tax=Listeria grandensis FSL F6-0971 TaxID=1265819 RepID=W7BDF1_9LIST|nr:histidinol dehydrogenase [Listeria grandensis]EUJ23962.1 bifunctional histidinal dehydrogenase/ histidinol dehydrogenase [Listeria grandensis FSL F6-0971]